MNDEGDREEEKK